MDSWSASTSCSWRPLRRSRRRSRAPIGSGKLNVPETIYDAWLEALIQAAGEYDPVFDQKIEAAWRGMMKKGIEGMKRHAHKGATGRTTPQTSPIKED